jgi:hypothetical protein
MITHPRFGNINQNRLRDIVRMKNEENNRSKKDILKKMDAVTLRQYDPKPALDKPAPRKYQPEVLPALPRIKVHS